MFHRALFFVAACAAALAAEHAKIVVVAGKPSHGPRQHEFNAGAMLLENCLRQNKGVETTLVRGGWPSDESVFAGASAIVLYMDGGARHPMIQDGRLETLGKLMGRGVGLACLHYAVEVPKDHGGPELLEWIGGYYERPYSQNPINEVVLTRASPDHPVSRGWRSFTSKDEWYYKIRFNPEDRRVTPILTTMLPKDAPHRETVAWIVERADGGRGFGFTGGHYHDNWALEDQRRMVLNAILWTAKYDLPRSGAACRLSPGEADRNLDPKPAEPK